MGTSIISIVISNSYLSHYQMVAPRNPWFRTSPTEFRQHLRAVEDHAEELRRSGGGCENLVNFSSRTGDVDDETR